MRMQEEQEEEDEAKKQVVVPVPYRETATRRSHRVTPTNFISGDLTGKPQISGERLLPNGDFYTGSLSGQIPHGTGKYLWSDGCMYEGEWKNGKTAGKGKFSWPSGATYEGEFKSSFMDGFGIFTGSNGDTYRGFWSMNHKQGFGHKWYSNGDCYEGTWFRNLQEGQGRYVWKNGNEYVGEWKSGAIWGRGVLISVNGDRFDGQWQNGIPKGNGVFTWSDGSFYVGTWNHDPNQNNGVFYPPPSSSIDDDCSMVDRDSKVSAINWSRKRSSVDGRGSLVERNLSSNFPRICIWESDGEAGDITCDIVDNALMFYRDGYCQEKNLIKRRAPCCFLGEDKKKPGQTISKGHKNYDLMLNLQLGIRYSVGKTAPYQMRDLRPADFDPREKYWTRFPVEGSKVTPPHQSVEFRWKDYCPMVFRHLRGLFEIDAADYMLSICGNDALRELSSPGKSGSFFYLTQDDRFMIKTVKKSEVKVLLRMLPSYYYHVSRYENSLVTRFFGVHCVKPIGGQKVRFIVMGNLFCSEYRIHRRFDLKGSSHGRSTDKPEGEIDETTTLKDLDLNFVFRLPGTWFQELIKQIDRDCEFLEAERIMDYSLLVGLHFRDPSAAKLGQSPFLSPRKDELDPDERDESQGRCSEEEHDKILVGRKPLIRLGANMPARAEHVARTSGSEQNQSESSEGDINEVILYFGIIDILQDYDISKKLEHAYKSFQADPTSISAVDPKLYSKRFRDFIGRIFVED